MKIRDEIQKEIKIEKTKKEKRNKQTKRKTNYTSHELNVTSVL